MFCIAAFIVLAILGIFSASHRKLASKAWYCVLRRITFKPCDINFGEEMKGQLLGKIIITKPRLAKFLDRWIDWVAFMFVVLTIWSLISVFLAGLNLWVYDTCNPVKAESCSLSGEACGIGKEQLSFIDAVEQNKFGEWAAQPFITFGETISRIPDRLKSWNAKDYLSSTATFYYNLQNEANMAKAEENKDYAVEILDPGCIYCKKLFGNIKKAGFENKYSLSYLLYPIPDFTTNSGYKFPNSYLMATYIEAAKKVKPQGYSVSDPNSIALEEAISSDWQLLEKIFTDKDNDGVEWQTKFNLIFSHEEAEQALQKLLGEIGYNKEETDKIVDLTQSEEVKNALKEQKEIVENKVKTIKIPTIIFGERRYDRVIDVDQLK